MRALEVDGKLELTVDQSVIEIVAEGSQMRAEIGNISINRKQLRQFGASIRNLRILSQFLESSALRLTLTRHHRPFLEIGAGVRGGPMARLLGLNLVRLAGRSRPE